MKVNRRGLTVNDIEPTSHIRSVNMYSLGKKSNTARLVLDTRQRN